MVRTDNSTRIGSDRERRILIRMAVPGAMARPDPDGGYTIRGGGLKGRGMRISQEVMQELLARELVSPARDGAMMLSEIGHASARRLHSAEDGFRAQHQVAGKRRITEGQQSAVYAVNEAETPLGWLRHRRGPSGAPFLSAEEFEAGERLREDFTLANLSPSVTHRWGALMEPKYGGPRAGEDIRDVVIAAKKRFFVALDAVGPGLSEILVQVCCHLEGLEQAERSLQWPSRSGKVVLKIALQRLAHHYGLVAPAGRGGRHGTS